MTAPTAPTPSSEHHRAPVGRIVMTVVGALLIVISLGFGAIGTVLTWAYATQRDSDGFFTSGTHRLESITAAITSENLDLGVGPGRGNQDFDLGDVATVRLRVESQNQRPIFIGIGPARDVDAYLANVGHAEIDSIDVRPFRVTYNVRTGAERAAPPRSQNFWVASAEGLGAQEIQWDLESGRWSIVVMNASGARGVAVDADVGVQSDWVLPLGIGLLVGFGAFALVGTVLLVVGAAGLGRRLREPAAPGAPPVQLTGHFDTDLSRWLWLVKWILLIPHFIALAVLWLAFVVVSFIAFFAILFTGRYPRALFDFNAGVLRWSWRVGFYSFAAFGTDRYPPFTLGPAPDYPARLEIAYPERLSRGLVLVKWWLLAIPQYIVLGIFGGGVWLTARDDAWAAGGPGLIGWLVFVAVVALLFVGRYPRGIANLVTGLNRWTYRVIVYAALMSDAYPPFRLDQGETEPAAEPAEPGVT